MVTINKRRGYARFPVNGNAATPLTHEGAPAKLISPEQELRRAVMACMLWENQFYEDGESITDRIKELVPQVDAYAVADMAIEAREDMKLRHVPLLLVREMARLESHKSLVAETLERIIQRADELTEFVAIYWKDGRQPLSAQVKKGLVAAFIKFDAYSLAKYNRDGAVKLRDVMFLVHPKPTSEAQAETFKQLAANTLPAPDTWEVALSGGANKRETWERLITEGKLGGLAFIRNLRNMTQAGVDTKVIYGGFDRLKTDRILPFRFIAAARHAPQLEEKLEMAMFRCLGGHKKLAGKTVLLIDVSASMNNEISSKSDLRRLDAACGLAMLLREVCEDVSIFSFSDAIAAVPSRHGFALRDAVVGSQPHGGTELGKAVNQINKLSYNRLIVLTDEQATDYVGGPRQNGYIINVASYRNGVGYGAWTHIDGWSEKVIDYIMELEAWRDGLLSGKD